MAAEEDWIWGNHRGGGGAPVKTVSGEQVSNLREVARGNVEVDHLSPSARRSKGHHASFDDREYEGGVGRNRGGDYDYDLGGGGGGWGRGGRRSRHTSYDDVDRNHNNNHPHSPRGQQKPVAPAQFVSPSHRGARKNMFVSDSEREQRTRKAREYQESLREQVEEKRRQKEATAREQKKRQQQEYDEYMSHNFRGQVSPSGGHSARRGGERGVQHSPQRAHDDYVGSRREQATPPRNARREQATPPRNSWREQATPPRNGRREQATPPRNGRRDQATPPRNGRREQATPPRNGRREQATPPRNGRREQATPPRIGRQRDGVISPIRSDKALRQNDHREGSGEGDGYGHDEGGGRGRGGRGGGDDWVSKVEYDELSTLCKGLLRQQQVLEEQLEQQSSIIQELQSAGAGGISGSKLSAKRGPRVRVGAAGAPVAGHPSTQRGEKKMTARQSAALAAAEKRKKPKVTVGFGSRIESTKDKEKKERLAANALRSQSHSGKRNAGKVPAAGDKPSPCRPSSMNAAPGGRVAGGGGGFKQLQAQAAAGPKVVTYDEDPAPVNGRGYKQQSSPIKRRAGAGAGGQSQELHGASDLLYIEGSDVDRISEDQLDKLLGKARGAR